MPFDFVPTHRGLVVSRGGIVATSQPLASSAGLAVLAGGGTFADAAIAASAVLCVVEPWASHLGGDAFAIVFDAARRDTLALNGSGAAPRTATRDAYPDGIPERGLRAATVPGLVSAWAVLHERWGSRPLSDLLRPAIAYARDGFPAGPRWVRVFGAQADLLEKHPSLQALGAAPDVRLGETIHQPDLAWTLEQIAAHEAGRVLPGRRGRANQCPCRASCKRPFLRRRSGGASNARAGAASCGLPRPDRSRPAAAVAGTCAAARVGAGRRFRSGRQG
jgi:gamma-glutamyltranspeptidase/glutathione hydrolase